VRDYRDVVAALDKIGIDVDPVEFSRLYGYRFNNAWAALKENRVKKYVFKPSSRVLWVVVGKGREYLIYPEAGFCSCDDFYFGVIDGRVVLCYHLIARKLAEVLGCFDVVEEDDRLYMSLMEEWREVKALKYEVLNAELASPRIFGTRCPREKGEGSFV